MKKIFVLAAVSVFVLASCKKDYVCDCHVDYNDGTPHEDIEYDIKGASKSDAEDACDNFESTLKINPIVEKVNCDLD